MVKRYRVIPYNPASRSARALAESLNGKRIKLEDSRFVPRNNDVIINWGNSSINLRNMSHEWDEACKNGLVGNLPEAVAKVSNKLTFFKLLKDAKYVPKFWTNKDDIPDEEFPIVCRTVLSGHSGEGIVIADTRDDLVTAPLYVKYMKKKDEYRVHVGRKQDVIKVISIQRKARSLDVPEEEVNWQIRSHNNGFVFIRNNINPDNKIITAARECLVDTGLDFGAVDVIWNEHSEKAYVLEINTAPGLEGQTIEDYSRFFRDS